MFPYADFVLYTLGMIAWIEKHPSRKLLLTIAISWVIGKIAEGFFYGRPWHFHLEWTAVLIVMVVWAKKHRSTGKLSVFLATFTIAGQNLFILNEPGIVPYQEWLFPLMFIMITWLSAHTFWELALALSVALLINQVLAVMLFQGIVRYLELPEPYLFNSSIVFLALLGFFKHKELWPPANSQDALSNAEQLVGEGVQLELEDHMKG